LTRQLSQAYLPFVKQALQMLEQAASLQRTCVNGQEVLTLILGHLLADLNEFGTIDVASAADEAGERNRLLKVTNAIISNGNESFDTTSAVKQWRCLRHLTAITTAVVTKIGYVVTSRPCSVIFLSSSHRHVNPLFSDGKVRRGRSL
jgi:hypothetical protein